MRIRHTLAFLLLATACDEMPSSAYYNRGDPENLLDVSSEVVNMNVNSTASLSDLSRIVKQDPPVRAEVNCDPKQKTCADAYKLLEKYEIPMVHTAGPQGVTLVYERVVARDCENRFIDNTINPYNLNMPTLGCSVAANTVQMVSNKRQFTNPSLMDYPDGEKAVQMYRVYLIPPKVDDTQDQNGSLLKSISTSN